jgi:hypothetical protein
MIQDTPSGKRLMRVWPWGLCAIALIAVTVALAAWRPAMKQIALQSMIPFDRESWRESPGQRLDVRMRMVRDLFDQHLALGTSRSDALALLGPPNHSRTLPTDGDSKRMRDTYWLDTPARGTYCLELSYREDRLYARECLQMSYPSRFPGD